MLSIWVFCINR